MESDTANAAKLVSLADFTATRDKVDILVAAFRFGVSLRDRKWGVFYLPHGLGGYIVRDGDGYKSSYMVWAVHAETFEAAEAALYGLVREHQPSLLAPDAAAALARLPARSHDDAAQQLKKPRTTRA